jgi:hypothetical protein
VVPEKLVAADSNHSPRQFTRRREVQTKGYSHGQDGLISQPVYKANKTKCKYFKSIKKTPSSVYVGLSGLLGPILKIGRIGAINHG